MSQTQQQIHGRIGEDAAAAYYEKEGYRVIERNYRVSHKEIDLIVENNEYLVFVEVKSRIQAFGVRSRYGRPADAVNRQKRHLTVLAAKSYLRHHAISKQPRIDRDIYSKMATIKNLRRIIQAQVYKFLRDYSP